jgi:hypothetical protein
VGAPSRVPLRACPFVPRGAFAPSPVPLDAKGYTRRGTHEGAHTKGHTRRGTREGAHAKGHAKGQLVKGCLDAVTGDRLTGHLDLSTGDRPVDRPVKTCQILVKYWSKVFVVLKK